MEASRTSVSGRAAGDAPDARSPGQRPALVDRLAAAAVRLLGCRSAQVTLSDSGTVVGRAGGSPSAPSVLVDLTALDADGSSLQIPVSADDGRLVGWLRVTDHASRTWAAADEDVLHHLAPAVAAALDVPAHAAHAAHADLAIVPVVASLTNVVSLADVLHADVLHAETASGDDRVARALDSVAVAFLTIDALSRVQYLNVAAERLLKAARAQAVGRPLADILPTAALPPFTGAFADAASRRRAVVFEAPVSRDAPTSATWCEVRVSASPDGLTLTLLDVTAVRAARLRTARMAERTALLARVTAELAETLDARTALARLARLVVPSLAEVSVVAVGSNFGLWEDAASWHRLGASRASLAGAVPGLLAGLAAVPSLKQRLKPASGLRLTPSEVAAFGPAASVLPAGASALVLPLRARGRALGVVVLFRHADADGAHHDDAAIAQEITARAALTLDNARLYKVQHDLAEGLQRRMLTDAPPLPGLATAVRYLPASTTASVGGDWYDVFVQPPGLPMFVIGDVVGHDTAAAALMGQVRALLRGIAHTTGQGPAEVLRRLDAAMEGLRLRTTATAAVVRLEGGPSAGAGSLAEGVQLRWANAGHPPPMLVLPDSSVKLLSLERLPGTVPDLLLGVDAGSARHEQLLPLPRGATLLLYTDGLVERRDLPVQQGIERLAEHLGHLAHEPLEDLCDALLERLVPGAREDDVALLAVRLAG